MSVTVQTRTLRLVRTSVEWASDNPELPDRVQGFDSTLRRYKMGNGTDTWSVLPWWSDETESTPAIVDIPISTVTPLVIDYTPYAAFGTNPILELQIFRTDNITAQVFVEIERDLSISGTITIPFDGMPTLDHYQLVISQR